MWRQAASSRRGRRGAAAAGARYGGLAGRRRRRRPDPRDPPARSRQAGAGEQWAHRRTARSQAALVVPVAPPRFRAPADVALLQDAEWPGSTELQRHSAELKPNPSERMPWNYRETLARRATPRPRKMMSAASKLDQRALPLKMCAMREYAA